MFPWITGQLSGKALSANFGHLEQLSPELFRLGVLAERFFADDANTSLIKSRQFGEYMVKEIAALSGVYDAESRETSYCDGWRHSKFFLAKSPPYSMLYA